MSINPISYYNINPFDGFKKNTPDKIKGTVTDVENNLKQLGITDVTIIEKDGSTTQLRLNTNTQNIKVEPSNKNLLDLSIGDKVNIIFKKNNEVLVVITHDDVEDVA